MWLCLRWSGTQKSLAKLEGAEGDLKLALERRSRLQAALQKYQELKIVHKSGSEGRTTEGCSSSSRCGGQQGRGHGDQGTAHTDSTTDWAFSKPWSAVEEESADPTSLAAQLKAQQRKTAGAQPP